MTLFVIATLLPAALLCLGAVMGGLWIWAGVGVMTVLCYLVDRLAHGAAGRKSERSEFPTGNGLSILLALLHPAMLALAVWSLAGENTLTGMDHVGTLIGFGLFFGQVGHPNAHELIHRQHRWLRRLGVMIYATLLMGHHVSAHRLVHHVYVGTDQDPNSAAKGTGFWRFALRVPPRSFIAGYRAEKSLIARKKADQPALNPYLIYSLWALIAAFSSFALGGTSGITALLGLAVYAQLQVLLADYVQHYGLRRPLQENGKPAPVGPVHSWNSPHMGSSAMMLNAPRHSDHHMHPSRHYPALDLNGAMPVLPYSLPVMAVIALWPPLWRRVMDKRVDNPLGR